MYLDLHTRGPFTETSEPVLEECLSSPPRRSSWAGAVATPGTNLRSQRSSTVSLGGPAAGGPVKSGKETLRVGGAAFGMPGYGGMGAWGGWEDWEDVDSFVDPIATVDNVRTKALAAHPSQPIFLVGSNNTHVYLWEVCISQKYSSVIISRKSCNSPWLNSTLFHFMCVIQKLV